MELNFSEEGGDGMKVLRGWVRMKVKPDGDGIGNEICGNGGIGVIFVSMQVSSPRLAVLHRASFTQQ